MESDKNRAYRFSFLYALTLLLYSILIHNISSDIRLNCPIAFSGARNLTFCFANHGLKAAQRQNKQYQNL